MAAEQVRHRGTKAAAATASDDEQATAVHDPVDASRTTSLDRWPAPLPHLELAVYFAFWIANVLYACYAVWHASEQFGRGIWGGFFEPGWALLGSPRKDVSNYEWIIWSKHVVHELPWCFGHLIIFNLAPRLLGTTTMNWHPMMLLYWLLSYSIYFVGIACIGIAVAQALLVLLIAQIFPRKSLVWITSIALLVALVHFIQPTEDQNTVVIFGIVKFNDRDTLYEVLVFFAYKTLHLISFTLNDIDERRLHSSTPPRSFLRRYYEMLWYTFYMPYNCTLIVTYNDFRRQLANREQASPGVDWRQVISLVIRVTFWSFLNDFILHVVFFNALMVDSVALERISHVNLAWLASIGYISGQFFHTKYMSIFGIPTIVATIDRMQPPGWPPVCISRIALYASMWRYFDRGLYSFLRTHVFVPTLQASRSIIPPLLLRRALASALCFSFVWLWHGATLAYFVWVSLNFVESMLESVAKHAFENCVPFRALLDRLFAHRPRAFRRFVACLQIPCVSLGILGIFYFIGGKESGDVFTKRFIYDNLLWPRLPWLYLFVLGYCYCQVCIELDVRFPPGAAAGGTRRGNDVKSKSSM